MKITHVTTRVLRTPADIPLVVGLPAPTDTREFVTLELGTDEGLVGLGLTFFGGALTAALRLAMASTRVGSSPTTSCARIPRGSKPSPASYGQRRVRLVRAAFLRWRCPPWTSPAGTSRAKPKANR